MKRKFNPAVKVCIFLILTLCIYFTACRHRSGENKEDTTIPRTGKVIVKPYWDSLKNGSYCTYKITAIKGAGALKIGDIMCILCKRTVCDNFSEIQVAEGIVYTVTAQENGLPCVSCSTNNTFQEL